MNEFPKKYPNATNFMEASAVFNFSSLIATVREKDFKINPAIIGEISTLMRPKADFDKVGHRIKMISPTEYPTFDTLLKHRQSIRDLQLVPKRRPEMQVEYDRMPRELFLFIVNRFYLDWSPVSITTELYPYDLPPDLQQYVVWLYPEVGTDYLAASFIANVINLMGLTSNDVIMFERSSLAKKNLLRPSLPEVRHIHLWLRKF